MKIGIPNRSSFLHTGATALCMRWGVLHRAEYHAARLYYSSGGVTVALARAATLCELLEAGELDLIFTGEDYAAEHLVTSRRAFRVPLYEVRFALFQRTAGAPVERVVTKFPRVAEQTLSKWDIACPRLEAVSGATETFCLLDPKAAAFDVICTGITQRANQLHVMRSGPPLGAAWYSANDRLPDALADVLSDAQLMSRVSAHYARYLSVRDEATRVDIANVLDGPADGH